MKKTKLIILIILLGLLPSYSSYGAVGYETVTITTTLDGYIRESGGSFNDYDTGLTLYIGNGGAPTDRAYARFNVSVIPDTAVIWKYEFLIDGHSGSGADPTYQLTNITSDIIGQSASSIYYLIGNGTNIDNNISRSYLDETYILGTDRNANCTAFESSLEAGTDYFIIGILSNDEGTIGRWLINSLEGSETPKPSLKVYYYSPTPSQYGFSGVFYENGTRTDAANITATDGIMEIFELDGSLTRYYNVTPTFFQFSLGTTSRYLATTGTLENFTVFTPESTYALYAFTILDYTTRIGVQDAWLEAYRGINGSDQLVERQRIYDVINPVPINLVVGATYHMYVRFGTGETVDLRYFVATSSTSHTYTIDLWQWEDRAHLTYEHITSEATRVNSTYIRVQYQETIPEYNTVSANITIKTRAGSVVYTENTAGLSSKQFNWYNADNETDYVVTLNAQVGHYGEIKETWLLDYPRSFSTFPDITALGSFGIAATNLIAIITGLIVGGGTFSYLTRKFAPFVFVAVLAIFTYLGGATYTGVQIGVGFTLSILYALSLGGNN
jgi:hypothetical protein